MSLATLKSKVEQLILKAQSGGDDFAKNLIEGNLIELNTDASKIRNSAFRSYTKLTKVNAPNVTAIENNAFDGCTNLTEVNMPKISYLGGVWAFQNCTKLTTVNIPNVTIFAGSAFKNSGITQAHFEKLTSADSECFNGCKNLTSVYLPKLKKVSSQMFANCTALTEITLPNTVTEISSYAFNGCANLLDIYVPWAEGTIANAPWGATNATIHYNHNAEV